MFGDIEVPVQIIKEGKVALCVTTGNGVSCSEVREFEYRVKIDDRGENILPEVEGASKSSDELLLLVRFVQMLLSDSSMQKGYGSESTTDILENSKAKEDSWSQVIESLLFGTPTSIITVDWLLQELLKNKLQQRLSSKLQVKITK
ncbi:hypothetical protein FXO38_15591 [Capsicum annuum]|nr:hypothetical protein FXO38_15591 [Capsicum annuum]